MDNPFLTASLTIIGGVIVFVAGQLISKLIIDPLDAHRAVVGRIAHTLVFFQNIYNNPGTARPELNDEAAVAIREVASDLIAKSFAVPAYEFLENLGLVRSRSDIWTVHRELIGLSNSVRTGDASENEARRVAIMRLLDIRVAP